MSSFEHYGQEVLARVAKDSTLARAKLTRRKKSTAQDTAVAVAAVGGNGRGRGRGRNAVATKRSAVPGREDVPSSTAMLAGVDFENLNKMKAKVRVDFGIEPFLFLLFLLSPLLSSPLLSSPLLSSLPLSCLTITYKHSILSLSSYTPHSNTQTHSNKHKSIIERSLLELRKPKQPNWPS
jgi:hypothetical protein